MSPPSSASKTSARSRTLRTLLLSSAVGILVPGDCPANPAGEVVRHGAAHFERSGNALTIHQASEALIVDWNSFSIAPGQVTEFVQPGSRSAALNRVLGGSPSQIDGLLRANGRVLLVNPSGVVIGPGGRLDVGGFIASSLDVSDSDFLAGGELRFRGEAGAGAVANLGTIHARDGDVFLFGPEVLNAGTISAPNGTVGLGAGTQVLLKPSGSERVFVEGAGSVVNEGSIAANVAELKARGGNVYAMAVQNKGRVVATGVQRRGGQIFLTGKGGRVSNTGTLRASRGGGGGGTVRIEATEVEIGRDGVVDASGDSRRGGRVGVFAESLVIDDGAQVRADGATVGGSVRLTGTDRAILDGMVSVRGGLGRGGEAILEGADIQVGATAAMDASGGAGGGGLFVGGGFQGGDPGIANALTLAVEAGASLRADALDDGHGGTVILWSDDATRFLGSISARGAGPAGNGGFAEVSGKRDLLFHGAANLAGSGAGTGGLLLLDPTDFTIDLFTATAIETILNTTTNVVVSTDSAGGGNGDIFVNSAITTTNAGSGSLTLLAHRHIEIGRSIQLRHGDLNLVAGWDGTTGFGGVPGVSTFPGANLAAIAADPGSYGNAGGEVRITTQPGFGAVAAGSHAGTTRVFANGLSIQTTGDDGAEGRLGFASSPGTGLAGGAIEVEVRNGVDLFADRGTARIGHAGENSALFPGLSTGDIRVRAFFVNLDSSGEVDGQFAQIGHGSPDGFVGGDAKSGDISVETWSDIQLSGGFGGTGNQAQIGHRSANGGDLSGSISVSSGAGALSLSGGGIDDEPSVLSFALVGHYAAGGLNSGAASGRIDVFGDSVELSAGGGFLGFAFNGAQIGHSAASNTGAIEVSAFGDSGGTISLLGGGWGGDRSFTRIGHGRIDTTFWQSSSSGGIEIATSLLEVRGGEAAALGFAQIGHEMDASGNITVSAGNLNVVGGSAGTGAVSQNFAKIGHGSRDSDNSGDIEIDVFGSLLLEAGTTGGNAIHYAQIGHGAGLSGAGNDGIGVQSGGIVVRAEEAVLRKPGTGSEFALLGHGDLGGHSAALGGSIQLVVEGDLTLSSATAGGVQVGHATSGAYMGDTFVGVGQGAPATVGTGSLVSDLGSVFTAGGNELRFYAADRPDVSIPVGALLNNVALAADNPYTNEVGFSLFGTGPYLAPFSFYFGDPLPPPPPPPVPPLVPAVPTLPPPGPPLGPVDITGGLIDGIGRTPGIPEVESQIYVIINEFFAALPAPVPFPGLVPGSGGQVPPVAGTGLLPGDPSVMQALPGAGEGGFPAFAAAPGQGLPGLVPGIYVFEENGLRFEAVPPEIAALLAEHLGPQAVLVLVAGGLVDPESGLVEFGAQGVFQTFHPLFGALAGQHLGDGTANELENAIGGEAGALPVAGNLVAPVHGIVAFSLEEGVLVQLPPEPFAAILAEHLGAAAAAAFGPPGAFVLAAGDGAEFSPEAVVSPIPEDPPDDLDEAVSDLAAAELEAAFGG